MNKEKYYRNLFEVIIEGDKDNQDLQDYITKILPEKSSDKEYIERITCKVCDIYNAVDLDLDIYWIADNYVSMLREVEAF